MLTETLYVATDIHGLQHLPGYDRRWVLPRVAHGTSTPGPEVVASSGEHDLVLFDAAGLLDELGERIFVAELGDTDAQVKMGGDEEGAAASPEGTREEGEEVHRCSGRRGRLLHEAAWDASRAARFALECASHVLGDAAAVSLPHGPTLAEVLAEARRFLDEAGAVDEQRLGFLARVSVARRLRRTKDRLGRLAGAVSDQDVLEGLDALDDPAWATVAALGDAVLAAIEALTLLALPRYVAQREQAYDAGDSSGSAPVPQVLTTPWGPVLVGGSSIAEHVPTYISARDAAERSRLVSLDRDGKEAEAAERSWQAELLEKVLASDHEASDHEASS